MGKEDKLINYKEENELLRNEIEFLNSRINTLIKEVAANGETIKARDAKCKELVAASNKNAKTAKYYRDKLSAAVKMYEEEAYLVDQQRKKDADIYEDEVKVLEHWLKEDAEEIKKLKEIIKQNEEDLYYMDQKQKDYVIKRGKNEEQIRELQEEVVSLRRKNRELEAIRKKMVNTKTIMRTEIASLEDQIDSLLVVFSDVEKKNNIYKDEIRKLNAACRRKNDLINKLYGALNYDGWSKMWEDDHEHN